MIYSTTNKDKENIEGKESCEYANTMTMCMMIVCVICNPAFLKIILSVSFSFSLCFEIKQRKFYSSSMKI